MQAEILASATDKFGREWREMIGFGWIDELSDALKSVSDAQAIGVDPVLLQNLARCHRSAGR